MVQGLVDRQSIVSRLLQAQTSSEGRPGRKVGGGRAGMDQVGAAMVVGRG